MSVTLEQVEHIASLCSRWRYAQRMSYAFSMGKDFDGETYPTDRIAYEAFQREAIRFYDALAFAIEQAGKP